MAKMDNVRQIGKNSQQSWQDFIKIPSVSKELFLQVLPW
jgi:hypothetical protein